MAKAKYIRVADRLGERIRLGDYHLNSVPSERRLAHETGVSLMTARKAMQKLVDDGMLHRDDKGRARVNSESYRVTGLHQLAVVVPAYQSPEVQDWTNTLAYCVGQVDCVLRTVHYAHWDDPTLTRALRGFTGSFFLPLGERPPAHVMATIRSLDKPMVIINQDWTEVGLPSMRLYAPVAIQALLDHLYSIGCRRIGCYNVQPEDSIVMGRIQQWRLWMTRHGLQGPLVHRPVKPFENPLPAAHQSAGEVLDAIEPPLDAVLCVTEAAALGLSRAMTDRGLRPGADLSVCSVNSEVGQYVSPSITSLSHPEIDTLVKACIDWMCESPATPWIGPLMLEPKDLSVEVRESTRSCGQRHAANNGH